jgi:hypothetical protein
MFDYEKLLYDSLLIPDFYNPLQYRVTITALEDMIHQFWNIAENAEGNKEKIQAIAQCRETHLVSLEQY